MIWSHLPRRMEENGAVRCPIEVPSSTWYVDKVIRGLTWCCRVGDQAEFSDFQLEEGMGERKTLEEEDGLLFVKQTMDDGSAIGGNMVEPELF